MDNCKPETEISNSLYNGRDGNCTQKMDNTKMKKLIFAFIFLLVFFLLISLAGARSDIVDVLYPNGQTATTGIARGENVELIPNGDTLLNQWTQYGCTGAGNHYQCIDDPVATPDDATTYLEEAEADLIEAFRIPNYSSLNYPSSPDTIKNIDIIWRMKSDGDGFIKAGVRVGSSYTWGTERAYIPWTTQGDLVLTCPSCTWNETNLNGAMPCLGVGASNLGTADATQIYLRFDWIRNAGATDMYKAIWEHTVDDAKSYLLTSAVAADSILGIWNLDDYTLTTDAIVDSVCIFYRYLCSAISETEGFLPFLDIDGDHFYSENCSYGCGTSWSNSNACTWGATNPHSGNPWTDGDIDSLRVGTLRIGTSLVKEKSTLYVRVVSHLSSTVVANERRVKVLKLLSEEN